MITLEEIDHINAIEEDDLTMFSAVLLESLQIKRIYKKKSIVEYKEDMIDGVIDLLKKMLLNETMSGKSKLDIINLLDKFTTQKEYLELIRSKISVADIKAASQRLSEKSQSAFELK